LIRDAGPFAVVVTDLRMPRMDGVEVLSRVKELSPATVRLMLTGHADLDAAIASVNDGHVYRFLTKPCPPPVLKTALDAALEQYRLVTAEKELLRDTLRGAIKILTDTLAILKPDVYGRTSRLLPYIRQLSAALGDPQPWMTETAAMLACLGYIILPDDMLARLDRGQLVSRSDRKIYEQHVDVAERLISNLPRMDEVSAIIRYQDKDFDGGGFPGDLVEGTGIPLGARILRVTKDLDRLISRGARGCEALQALRRREGAYDPAALDALSCIFGNEPTHAVQALPARQLWPGMILAQDVFTQREGREVKIAGKGQELSETTVAYLRRYAGLARIEQPIQVIVPQRQG
jgi:response regulator RpfG family c-di-GMP phosphodiesterase